MDWARKEDAKLLAKRRWRARLIDYSRKFAPTLFWWSRIRHNLAQRIWPLISTPRIILSAAGRVAPELVRIAAKQKADLFVGHNLAGLPAAVIAAERNGACAGFDAEDLHSAMWLSETGPTLVDRLAEHVERRFIPQCDYVTAASPLIAKGYTDRYRLKLNETILNVFPLTSRPNQFRVHNPASPLTLYWFSQVIGADRGLEEVVQAVGICGSRNIELHLRGQWQPGYENKLRALVRQVGLQPDQLIWHPIGPPEEIVRLAAEYDVGLALEQPISENRDICLTNKIFVYLLAGNAIIGTATRAQKPLIENLNGAGVSYVAGNVEELAGYLRRLEQDRDALEQARRKAWQFGGEYYNWDIEKEKLLDTVGKSLHASALAK
jgi:glycosyltransferase involved in cell wall biosynthesis